jgi:hypothetical protein
MKNKIAMMLGVVALVISHSTFAGFVSDPQTHNHLMLNKAEIIKNLQEAKKHTDQLLAIKNEMGGVKDSIGYFKGDANSLKNDLLSWKTYYDKIDTLDSDNFSAFNWLGLDSLSSDRYAPNTANTINSGINSNKAFNDVKNKMFDDEKHPEEMKYRRQELAHNSMAASVVISNESKNTLSDSKQQIYKATEQSLSAKDLYDATIAQNKLLGIIASEMVQQRELQAQQLEMLASFAVRFEGTSKLTEPSRRSAAKRPWE